MVTGLPPLALDDGITTTGGGGAEEEEEVVVCLGGLFGDAYLVKSKADLANYDGCRTASVTKLCKNEDGRGGDDKEEEASATQVVQLSSMDYEPSSDFAAQVVVAGENRSLQVRL